MGYNLETLIGEDVPVTIDYDFQPEERQTLNYPGCRAEILINSITCSTTGNSFEGILAENVIDGIRSECWDHVSELAQQTLNQRLIQNHNKA